MDRNESTPLTMKKFFHYIALPFRFLFIYYWEILGIVLFLTTTHGLMFGYHFLLRTQVIVSLLAIGYIFFISDAREKYKNRKKDGIYWFRITSYLLYIISAIALNVQNFCL